MVSAGTASGAGIGVETSIDETAGAGVGARIEIGEIAGMCADPCLVMGRVFAGLTGIETGAAGGGS